MTEQHRRRVSRPVFRPSENLYRDAALLAIAVVLFFTVKAVSDNVNEVQSGRSTGSDITCAITSSVLEGTHDFIVNSGKTALPDRLTKSLEAQGYPPRTTREKQAVEQADAYIQGIEQRIGLIAGPQAQGLIIDQGPLAGRVDCHKLKKVTKSER